MTTMNTSCVGSRYRYGMRPEYQRCMGGSQLGAMVAARICPTTRRTNSPNSTTRSVT